MIDYKISWATTLSSRRTVYECVDFVTKTYNRPIPSNEEPSPETGKNAAFSALEFGEVSLGGAPHVIDKRSSLERNGSPGAFSTDGGTLDQNLFEQLIVDSFFETNNERPVRPYPSAGALYSVQTFIHVFDVSGYKPGTYHVLPKSRAIEFLCGNQLDLGDMTIFTQDLSKFYGANFLVLYAAAALLPVAKYGHLGTRLAALEAGSMYQLVDANSRVANLETRVFCSMYEEKIAHMLNADSRTIWPLIFQLVGTGE